jgi:transposase
MGVSRKCVKTWIDRFAAEGEAGLVTRSSRPHTMPTNTSGEVEQLVLAARAEHRDGQDVLGPKVGVPARTVGRILRRHGVPYLRECDPMTGEVICSSKQTAQRYEREHPGELVHMTSEARQDPQQWRLAHPRPSSDRRASAQEGQGRLRLRALPGRRPQPVGLLRDPARREGHDLRSVPTTGGCLVRRQGH